MRGYKYLLKNKKRFFKALIKKCKFFYKFPLTKMLCVLFGFLFFISMVLYFLENIGSYFEALWLGIVTISTTGYGDIIPKTVTGKVVSSFTMIFGIIITALLTATVTSLYFDRIQKTYRGHMSCKKLRNHFIICGWKANMAQFLLQMFQNADNSEISVENTVVVATPAQSTVDDMLSNPDLAAIKFVRGEYFDKDILVKANVMYAKKVFVIADEGLVSSKERIERSSTFEIDSRTVMAVLSIKTLNKNAYVCAQLLERSFDAYLQKANCDEIVFSDDIESQIIIKSIMQNGTINILSEIISGGEKHGIITQSIEKKFIGKKYSDLKESFKERGDCILLGILENTARHSVVWNEAVRDAQKTADFTDMVNKLKNVKRVRPYNPVFLPHSEYIIPTYSAAIVLGSKI